MRLENLFDAIADLDFLDHAVQDDGVIRFSVDNVNFVCSLEFVQDRLMYLGSLCPKTAEATEEEIAGWKIAKEKLDNMDWDAARHRVKFIW